MFKKYFEKLLEEDNENWIIYEKSWDNGWENNEIFFNKKGFILMNKNHLVFTFVYSMYRRQGVLKNLMKEIFNKYSSITLSSIDETTDVIWESFGFECISKREDSSSCSFYSLKNSF